MVAHEEHHRVLRHLHHESEVDDAVMAATVTTSIVIILAVPPHDITIGATTIIIEGKVVPLLLPLIIDLDVNILLKSMSRMQCYVNTFGKTSK